MKQYLISTGQISEKNFHKQHKKNKNSTKTTMYNELDDKILKLVKKGVTPLEIATCLNLNRQFIYDRQKIIFKKKKISKENLSEFKRKRKALFSDSRIKAKNELEEDSSAINSRKKFFELAKEEIAYGNNLLKTDVELLGRCIIINDNFLTKDYLKLVIMQYIKLGNYQEVKKFIRTLVMLYGDTDYGDSLKRFNELAREKLVLNKFKSVDTQNNPLPDER